MRISLSIFNINVKSNEDRTSTTVKFSTTQSYDFCGIKIPYQFGIGQTIWVSMPGNLSKSFDKLKGKTFECDERDIVDVKRDGESFGRTIELKNLHVVE